MTSSFQSPEKWAHPSGMTCRKQALRPTPSDSARPRARYHQPLFSRSVFEMIVARAPLVTVSTLALWMVKVSTAWVLVTAAFLVRPLMIQHARAYGSLFRDRQRAERVRAYEAGSFLT